MDDATIFYIAGGALTASAIVVSLLGLKMRGFPGKASPLIVAWFVLLVGVTGVFVVKHSQHEEVPHEEQVGLPAATQEAERAENE